MTKQNELKLDIFQRKYFTDTFRKRNEYRTCEISAMRGHDLSR